MAAKRTAGQQAREAAVKQGMKAREDELAAFKAKAVGLQPNSRRQAKKATAQLGKSSGGGAVQELPDQYKDEAVTVALRIMRVADVNSNQELSFTELTTMLGGSPYAEFGEWVAARRWYG